MSAFGIAMLLFCGNFLAWVGKTKFQIVLGIVMAWTGCIELLVQIGVF